MRLAKRCHLEHCRDAAATGYVGLQHVDGGGGEHATEVEKFVTVLSSGNFHARGSTIANGAQAVKIVRRNRLFKPGDVEFCKRFCLPQSLLAVVCSIGIYVEICAVPNRVTRDANAVNVF